MKKFRIFPLILLLCLLFALSAPAALALDAPELSAQAVILVDLDSGLILYEKNSMQQRSPASLTKVMTVLLTLEAVERGEATLDDVVTAGPDCQNGLGDDSSSVYIMVGEQMTLRDLVYCAMVSSGNDACNVIASYLAGGSISAFVERMNERAAELGCSQTHFVDPNGLSNSNQTCAYELYLITRAAMRFPEFMDISNTISYTVPATNTTAARELKNSNALISTEGIYGSGYLYEYAAGVKTGYTRAAGYCLISTAEKDGMHLLGIVMGCDGPYLTDTDVRNNFTDSSKLYDWAFENFTRRTILAPDQIVSFADVALSQGDGRVGLRPQKECALLLPNDAPPGEEDVRVTLYDENLTAPIEMGTVLGEAQVYYNGVQFASVKLVASGNVELARWEYFKQRIQSFLARPAVVAVLLIIAVLAIAYITLVLRYRALRRRHLKQRRAADARRRELARQRELEASQAEETTPFDRDLY